MRIGWLTDIHFDFVLPPRRSEFYAEIRAERLDVMLLGGDIGEADSVTQILLEMESELRIPIYFVLGNHDFYRGSIAAVREAVARTAAASRWLHWLPASGVVPLTVTTALVGHDSWADGRLGDYQRSEVLLNDYFLIAELLTPDKQERYAKLNALGDEAAQFLEDRVSEALTQYRNILVLTHVPPFRESCWHQGRISNDDYLPHFACRAVGDRLAAIMGRQPDKVMTVLCGHTHSPGTARILDNLTVFTGRAEYGEPKLQRVFDME
ncbi:MAG: metallophosphoesterase [Bryobacteraceae bacterium]|jgi:3',5'-cyclic AMP phosphodiesterase CpdA